MAWTAPTYDDLVATLSDAFVRGVQATVNGQPVLVNVSAGTANLTLIQLIALMADALYGKAELTDTGLRLRSATGTDLDDVVALTGVVRARGVAALVPVKLTRLTVTGSDVLIPTGRRVLATDATGAPTIVFLTAQDPTLPEGQSGVLLGGNASVWVYAQAVLTGAAGNIAAGQIIQIGDPIAGVNSAGNPAVATPGAPAVTPTLGSSTTTQYLLVANGVTGQTLPSALGQSTQCAAVLDSTHYNDLSWTAVPDAISYAVFKNIGTPMAPVWGYLATTASTTYRDNGSVAPDTSVALPAANTTNVGSGGSNDEGDTQLRTRAPLALAVAARATQSAVLGAVEAVSGVDRVFAVDAVLGGTPAPGTFQVRYTTTSGAALSGAGQAAVLDAINAVKAEGAVPDVARLVPVLVAIAYTVTKLSSVADGSALVPPINGAITAYLATLGLGAPVLFSQVVAAILSVPGTAAVTALTLHPAGGSTYSFADAPGASGQLYALGAITATVS